MPFPGKLYQIVAWHGMAGAFHRQKDVELSVISHFAIVWEKQLKNMSSKKKFFLNDILPILKTDRSNPNIAGY